MRRPPPRPIRKTILVTTLLALCALPGLRAEEQLPLPGQTEFSKPGPSQRTRVWCGTQPWYPYTDSIARRKLAQVLPEMTFDGVSFEQVIDYLRDLAGLNIVVNWTAVEAAAVEKDKEVNLRLTNVRIEQFLQLLLDEVGGGETVLGYTVEDEVVGVSTEEDLSRRTCVRVYDYGDMLGPVRAPQDYDENSESPMERLIQIIQETVAPESWRSAGGNVGAINTFDDLIIITQTANAHEQIYALLESIRHAREARP